MKVDAVVIGAGIGGLVTSTLLAKAGWQVLVLEQHSIPGGYCTSYRRKGFVFDIPTVLNEIGDPHTNPELAELGLYDAVQFRKITRFARLIFPDLEVRLPAGDLEGSRVAFRDAFPQQSRAVDAVFDRLEKLERRMGALQSRRRSLGGAASALLALWDLVRLSRTSFDGYCRRFTDDERLICALGALWGYGGLPPKTVSASTYLTLLAMVLSRPVHFPIGGYQVIPDFFAERLASYGGQIRYRTRVDRIAVEGGRASAVITDEGERFDCGVVISNADTRRTLAGLLERSSPNRRIDRRLAGHRSSASGIAVQLGTQLDLSQHDLDYGQIFISESWEGGDRFYQRALHGPVEPPLGPIHYGLQAPSLLSDGLAPAGAHVLHLRLFPADANRWQTLRSNGRRSSAEYRARKDAVADALIQKAEAVVPGLASSIAVQDVCTPPTFERYTGATDGAWYDSVNAMGRPKPRTSIPNLLLTGTKAMGGGGLPTAVAGGLQTARTLLR